VRETLHLSELQSVTACVLFILYTQMLLLLFMLAAVIILEENHFSGGRLRLKCDGTRAETRFRLFGETDESI